MMVAVPHIYGATSNLDSNGEMEDLASYPGIPLSPAKDAQEAIFRMMVIVFVAGIENNTQGSAAFNARWNLGGGVPPL